MKPASVETIYYKKSISKTTKQTSGRSPYLFFSVSTEDGMVSFLGTLLVETHQNQLDPHRAVPEETRLKCPQRKQYGGPSHDVQKRTNQRLVNNTLIFTAHKEVSVALCMFMYGVNNSICIYSSALMFSSL